MIDRNYNYFILSYLLQNIGIANIPLIHSLYVFFTFIFASFKVISIFKLLHLSFIEKECHFLIPSLHNESEIKFDLSAYGCSHMYTNGREKNVIVMQCHPYVRKGVEEVNIINCIFSWIEFFKSHLLTFFLQSIVQETTITFID